jgi:hypothetical protein
MRVKWEGGYGRPLQYVVMPAKSAKRVFALDVPGIHVFAAV